MKKNLLFLAVLMLSLTAGAQSKLVDQMFTEARMPQTWVEPAVKPLVCEVEIVEGAAKEKIIPLTALQVNSLGNDLKNVQNYGIFKWTEDEKCDMIVAATFNFYGNSQEGFTLKIKGFPANFKNWHTASPADYEWMKIPGSYYLNGRTLNPTVKDPK